ncbi:MAG: carboxypeptidase regulatory-like domain-containing protein [Campylobacterales bacterium]|nr:carboxypeptidase regulatory-like domain-containing protein [Campylobacterales bacterium]
MKKLIMLISLFTASLFLSSCGSSCNTTPIVAAANKVAVGNVVDGPIYNAIVEIYDMNGTLLATTTTNEEGRYSVEVPNLPTQYRVVVREGRDSSVDGEINANDENNSFIMSSIVTRDDNNESNESVGHVTPATTLVDSIVEDGALPMDDARDLVKERMGLELKEDLSKLDPKKHDLANKLGNFVALLAKMVPSDNRKLSFKAVAKIVIKKKIKIKISNSGLEIDDLNLSEIAHEAKELDPNGVSLEDIDKIASIEQLVKDQLIEVMSKIKAVAIMNDEDKKEALVAYNALFELLDKIREANLDELDEEELKLFVYNLQESVKAILDTAGIKDISSDDVDFIANLVKENLGSDVNEYKAKVVKAVIDYKVVIKMVTGGDKKHISLKKVIKLIYKNSDINTLSDIKQALTNEAVLAQLLKAVEELLAQSDSVDLQDVLEDILAAKMAQTIDDKNGTISGDDVDQDADKTVKNRELVTTLKVKIAIKVKIKTKAKTTKLTINEKAQLIAVKKVIQDIKVNVKVKIFTKAFATNADAMYEELLKKLEELYNGDMDALRDQIKALNLFVSDFSQAFSIVEFEEKISVTFKFVQQVKGDIEVDSIKTVAKLKVVVVAKFVINTKDSVVIVDEEEVKVNEVPYKPIPRVITIPQPKILSMPLEMLTNIKVAI